MSETNPVLRKDDCPRCQAVFGAPSPQPKPKPPEDPLEFAFWNFDARRKGDGPWSGAPQAERDAFKATVRALLKEASAVPCGTEDPQHLRLDDVLRAIEGSTSVQAALAEVRKLPVAPRAVDPRAAAAIRLAEAMADAGEWQVTLGALRCPWCHGVRYTHGHKAGCPFAAWLRVAESRVILGVDPAKKTERVAKKAAKAAGSLKDRELPPAGGAAS